jgi:hypothetical protein
MIDPNYNWPELAGLILRSLGSGNSPPAFSPVISSSVKKRGFFFSKVISKISSSFQFNFSQVSLIHFQLVKSESKWRGPPYCLIV